MDALLLIGNELHKTETEYHEKFEILLEGYNTLLLRVELSFLRNLLYIKPNCGTYYYWFPR